MPVSKEFRRDMVRRAIRFAEAMERGLYRESFYHPSAPSACVGCLALRLAHWHLQQEGGGCGTR
jgi:hypothetical protein